MGVVSQLVAVHNPSQCFALKTVKGASSIKDFDRECQTWLSVSHHPNIARALAFGAWQNLPSVLIDWYDQSLGDIRLSEMTADRIATLLRDIAEGLGFAHSEAGIIHRDIKPQNILIDAAGRARVSDFGIARCLPSAARNEPGPGGTSPNRGLHTGAAGTPYFMAPELWYGGQPNIVSDIFSLGVTFFHLLTGSHPHAGPFRDDPSRRLELLQDSIRGTTNDARALADGLCRCLSLRTSDRPSSYEEVAELAVRAGAERRELPRLARTSLQTVANAALVGAMGTAQDAEAILKKGLAQVPDDPILLCALADYHARTGNLGRCDAILIQAYSLLQRSDGVHNDEVHVRPGMAWASRLIDRQNWSEANAVIQEAVRWTSTPRAQIFRAILSRELGDFPEFGWHLLYDGHFAEAYEVLSRSPARAVPPKQQVVWWIAAAALSKQDDSVLDDISHYALGHECSHELTGHDLPFALASWWLHCHVNPVLAQRLYLSNRPMVLSVLSEIEAKHNLERGSLAVPGNHRSHAVLLGEIFRSFTGRSADEAARLLPKS